MIQKPMFSPQVEWLPPEEFKDLSGYDDIAIDLETKDPELKTMGSGSRSIAIKYICRHQSKGKEEDIKKAIHYLEMILERDYS